MKQVQTIAATFIMTLGMMVATTLALTSSTYAAPLDPCDPGFSGSTVCDYKTTRGDAGQIIRNIVNLLLYIVGASAVIVIIISGIKYTTSAGDAGQVANAKRTLLYAVVGLAVAMLAYVIVNWVFRTVNS